MGKHIDLVRTCKSFLGFAERIFNGLILFLEYTGTYFNSLS